jgi:glyoxylase I family protein
MLGFKAVSHVSLTVTDLERAKAFYRDVLGLRETTRPNFGFPGAWFDLDGGLSLHLSVKDEMPLRPADPQRFDTRDPHFALAVEDADDTYARLQASEVPFYDFAETPTGLRQLFIRDPDGNMIELIGPSKKRHAPRSAG